VVKFSKSVNSNSATCARTVAICSSARISRWRSARRWRHEAIRAEFAEEEAEVIEAEIAEKAGALEVPLHLRIDREFGHSAASTRAVVQIPTSALVRRLLRQAIHGDRREGPTVGEIEEIARRVAQEEIAGG
jgi:hypothetical protein